MSQIKIFHKKADEVHNLNHILVEFFLALETKDFTLTAKQLFQVFLFKKQYKCKKKDFFKALISLVKDGLVRSRQDGKTSYYEFNKTRYEMERVLRKMEYL